MFKITIDLPEKLKEPLEEISDKYSKLNKNVITPNQIIETVIRSYIAKEYGEILKSCRKELEINKREEDSNERSNKENI